MNTIEVTQDGKRWKITVNFLKRADYSGPALANKIAQQIHEKELPSYQLNLATVEA